MSWQLQEAKAKLSEVVKRAASEGPQEITIHGKPAVVVLSVAEYEKLIGKPDEQDLAEFLMNSPLRGSGIVIERDKSPPRPSPNFRRRK